ncbi:RagB/SusD family nutrient uptake outer membrane protein [Cryomorpha ignava]|uniref:RagB/SusD family nutrient uptake outer membrane protein n=1 Tax=Cryomorpha ignava TaxID=101383 RepID=A0A7K3WSC7_9FLAO|nr:RagB/SusD family nutrient uptake outer membrane protein [Cryomorpha ignava]NEN24599.1 RagB/SusD family nutrient uptake outer membrane protein [Cryomorpha ignava]
MNPLGKLFKSIFPFTVLFLFVCLTPSCSDDFLDNPPQGFLTDGQFPESAEDALRAVNAMYSDLRVWQVYYGGYPIVDIMSDDAHKGSNPGDGVNMTLFEKYTFGANIGDLGAWYASTYEAIKSTHVVIDKVPAIEMDETLKTRYIAQARFLRALHYFQLARSFGDVPKVTALNPAGDLPRSPKAEIYNEIIIPDLIFARDNLPTKIEWSGADAGRASKHAAQALLAKAYLYTSQFQLAADEAMEVVNSTLYDLEIDYSSAFRPEGEFGIESVFEVGALPFGTGAEGGNQFANTQSVRGTPNRGWGFNRPSLDLINSFEEDDVRMEATVIFLQEIIDGVLIEGDGPTPDETLDGDGNVIQIETYNQKVWVPGTDTQEPFGYNVKEMRYGEVLLIAAEALNEAGSPGLALIELNKIRLRAGLEDITETDQSILRALILTERRHEMALEQERFYDLVRTANAPAILGPLGFVSGKHENFPMPSSELLLNSNLTQNSGW